MTQFESSAPYDRIIRGAGVDLPRTDPGSLAAPGLAILPPTSRGAAMLEQGLAVLSAAGQAAGGTAAFLRRERLDTEADVREAEAESRRRQADAEEMERKAARYDAGLAGKAIDNDLVRDLEGVSTGAFDADPRPIPEILGPIISRRTEGQSKAYADAYNQGYRDQMETALLRRREARRAKARDDLNELGMRRAVTAPVEEFPQLISDYRSTNPGSTDIDAYASLVVPALDYAASRGDRARLESLSGVLGPEFAAEKAKASAALAHTEATNATKANAAFTDRITALRNRGAPEAEVLREIELGSAGVDPNAVESQRLATRSYGQQRLADGTIAAFRNQAAALRNAGRPASEVEAMVRAGGNTPGISPQMVEDELNATRVWDSGRQQETARLQKAHAIEAARASYVSTARSLAGQGRLWALENPGDLPDGTGLGITAKEAQRGIIDQEFARIAQDPSVASDPLAAVRKQAAFLEGNGVTYEPWKGLMDAGFAAAGPASLIGSDESKPFPQQSAAGFTLFKQISGVAPGALATLKVDPDAEKFYRLAATLQQDPQFSQDDGRALREAARLMYGPGRGSLSDVKEKEISLEATRIASRFFRSDATNPGAVSARIADLARVYTLGGVSGKDAVQRAAQVVRSQSTWVGSWLQPVGESAFPQELRDGGIDRAAAKAITGYLKAAPKDLYDDDDLTLIVDQPSGLVFLAEGRTGSVVPAARGTKTAFSMRELVSLIAEPAVDADAIVAKWRARRDTTPGPTGFLSGF